jgi:hypothetical protein
MPLLIAGVVFALFLSAPMIIQSAQNQVLDLVLPTDNDALFREMAPLFTNILSETTTA